MDTRDLAAIVTGGASGLGYATGAMLAERGAKVALFDRAEGGAAAAERLGGLHVAVDVADAAAVAVAVDRAEAAHGVARILVNCAGFTPIEPVVGRDGAGHDPGVVQRVVAVNLVGTFLMLAAFSARLATAEPLGEERGVIVNTASIAAFDGQAGLAAYAASKGRVVALTLPCARDLAPHAIRVVTIAPGMFQTPMVGDVPDDVMRAMERSVPFPRRLGAPEEFARLVAAIIDNPMLNGEVVRLDAGHRLPMSYLS